MDVRFVVLAISPLSWPWFRGFLDSVTGLEFLPFWRLLHLVHSTGVHAGFCRCFGFLDEYPYRNHDTHLHLHWEEKEAPVFQGHPPPLFVPIFWRPPEAEGIALLLLLGTLLCFYSSRRHHYGCGREERTSQPILLSNVPSAPIHESRLPRSNTFPRSATFGHSDKPTALSRTHGAAPFPKKRWKRSAKKRARS